MVTSLDRTTVEEWRHTARFRSIDERWLIVRRCTFQHARKAGDPSASMLKALMFCLQRCAGDDLECFPSRPAIAEELDCSVNQVTKVVAHLVALDVLVYFDEVQGKARRHYAMNYERLLAYFVPEHRRPDFTPSPDLEVIGEPGTLIGSIRGGNRGDEAPQSRRLGGVIEPITVSKQQRGLQFQSKQSDGASLWAAAAGAEDAAGRTVETIVESEWQLEAMQIMQKRYAITDRKAQRRLLSNIGTRARFIEIGQMVDRKQRNAQNGGAPIRSLPGLFSHFATNPELRLDDITRHEDSI